MTKSGDLVDCRKLYFGPGSPPSHRIVYRVVDENPSAIEIVEIVAVEERSQMCVDLLAAVRLGRIPTETKPEFSRVRQRVIAARAERRKRK
jgi:hypothetical protein